MYQFPISLVHSCSSLPLLILFSALLCLSFSTLAQDLIFTVPSPAFAISGPALSLSIPVTIPAPVFAIDSPVSSTSSFFASFSHCSVPATAIAESDTFTSGNISANQRYANSSLFRILFFFFVFILFPRALVIHHVDFLKNPENNFSKVFLIFSRYLHILKTSTKSFQKS